MGNKTFEDVTKSWIEIIEIISIIESKKWIDCNDYDVMNLRISSIDDIHWESLRIGMLYEIYELVLCWLDKKIHTTTSI